MLLIPVPHACDDWSSPAPLDCATHRTKGRSLSASFVYAGAVAPLDRPAQRRPREQAGGIEGRQRRIRVVHDQRDLGAAEHDSVAALVFYPFDDSLKVSHGLALEHAVNQFIHDYAIDFFAFGGVWGHITRAPATWAVLW